MKRVTVLLICALLLCVYANAALAAGSVSFSGSGTPTSFTRWSEDTSADGTWYLSWTTSNLSDGLKAAVKIYNAPGVYASHTFYYSSTSTSSHSYLPDIEDGDNVYVGGKKYSGSGSLSVSGTFNP